MNRILRKKVTTPLHAGRGMGVGLLLFCILLSSCGVYNKYERPDVETTGLIRDAVSDIDTLAVQDTASFGNLPWRAVFTDPQLQTLIEQKVWNAPTPLSTTSQPHRSSMPSMLCRTVYSNGVRTYRDLLRHHPTSQA